MHNQVVCAVGIDHPQLPLLGAPANLAARRARGRPTQLSFMPHSCRALKTQLAAAGKLQYGIADAIACDIVSIAQIVALEHALSTYMGVGRQVNKTQQQV